MARPVAAAVVLVLSAGCIVPTDRSAEVRAEVDVISDLIQGERVRIIGRVTDAAGGSVPNSEVRFSSNSSQIATVTGDTLLAIGVGSATITASAVGYQGAPEATRTVRVHDAMEIDSIRPKQRRWGEDLVIYGTGIADSSLFFVLVGDVGAVVKNYTPNDPQRRNRFGRLTVWVPPPAPGKSRVTILGVNGLKFSPDTATVTPLDLYEPNDITPANLGNIPIGLYNPALAFEPKPRNDPGADWYHFSNTAATDRSIILRAAGVQPEASFLTDSLGFDVGSRKFKIGSQSWTVGPEFYACHGAEFSPEQVKSDSFVVALKALPAGSFDLLSAYTSPGPYGMLIQSGYRSVLAPDSHEEDDFCEAPAVTGDPLILGNSRVLSIDNPGEVDWFRFTVQASLGPLGETVRFGVVTDSAEGDLDLYVLRAPPAAVAVVGSNSASGSQDALVLSLAPGNYYLVAVDYAGVPTPYTLHSSVLSIPAPPPSSTTSRIRSRTGRRPSSILSW